MGGCVGGARAIGVLYMEKDVEYLDTWPPHAPETRLSVDKSDKKNTLLIPSESSSLSATTSSGSSPQAKRFKHDLAVSCDRGGLTDCIIKYSFEEKSSVDLEQQLSTEELHIVRCDYSVSADALLARWWKMMMSKRSAAGHMTRTAGPAEEERVEFIAKSNAAPQTQLYHISRYI